MAVQLPEFARLLLAKKGPNGPLSHQGMSTLADTDGFDPNSRQVVTLTPATNRYAVVVFHVSYGQTPLYTFSVDIQHQGDVAFSGRLTGEDIENGHGMWSPVMATTPMQIEVTNDDPVVYHIFRIRLHYLVVNTREDWREVERVLQAYPGVPLLGEKGA